MHDHQKKGNTVKSTEHITNSASTPKTGLFATLAAFLRGRGTGAPKSTEGSGISSSRAAWFSLGGVLILASLAFTSAPALAAALETPELYVEDNTSAVTTPSIEARLHGVVNPGSRGEAGTYQFVYRPQSTRAEDKCKGAGENVAPVLPGLVLMGGYEEPLETITGLTAGTEYAVCLVVENNAKTESKTSPAVSFTASVKPEKPVTEPPEKVTGNTATLLGELNPHSEATNGYHFAYSTSGTCTGGSTSEPGTEEEAKERKVSTPVTGLEPLREYTVCVVSTNAAGEETFGNAVKFNTPAAAPLIESESVSSINAGGAQLEGVVNPNNEKTSAYLQYSASAAVNVGGALATATVLESSELGEGYGGQPVGSGAPTGLPAGSTFYYQVVATNATGTTYGQVQNFTTVPTPTTDAVNPFTATTATFNGSLTPLNPVATQYSFAYNTTGECDNGLSTTPAEATSPAVSTAVTGLLAHTQYTVCMVASNAFGSEQGSPVNFETPVAAPTIAEESVTEDSATGVRLNAEIDPGGAETTYHFEYDTVPYEEGEAAHGKSTAETALFASDNGEHRATVLIQGLGPSTTYHYRLVATNSIETKDGPDHTFTTHSAGAGFALPDGRMWEQVSPVNKEGAEITTVDLGFGGDMQASEDGGAVTYVASAPLGAGVDGGGQSSPIENQVLTTRGAGGAWSSQDLDTPHDYASASENGVSLEPDFGELDEYLVFSPDLSLAYVEPEGHTQLASTPVVKDGENERETYVRNNSTGVFTATMSSAYEWYAEQVARAQGPSSCDASTSPAHGEGVDVVSSDGCYVYFNSESVLVAGATSGQSNLYVSHFDGSGWETTFISSLSGTGFPEWGGQDIELSPNGQYVAFMSNVSLTGYDNVDVSEQPPTQEEEQEKEEHGENPKTRVSHHDEEVFEYDAATNRLVCASCDPTGARPVGVRDPGFQAYPPYYPPLMVDRNDQWSGRWLAGMLPDWTEKGQTQPIYQPRYIFNGGRLLFNSPDALVPADVNGLQDVYEYEPEGVPEGEHACSAASTSGGDVFEPEQEYEVEGRKGQKTDAGCVALISSGTSKQESAFVDASASGGDVFFLTSARLATQDDDNAYDVYDAHICGAEGVPCAPVAAVSSPPCDTEASCKAAPSPQPEIYGAPASSTFTGAGNLTPTPTNGVAPKKKAVPTCKRGFVRNKKGKCVRKKAKRAKRANTKRRAHR